MRPQFPLFNTPLDMAHEIWKDLLLLGDTAIDATCGNGKDSLVLARILEPLEGKLVCIDIQEKAIENTKAYLEKEIPSFLPSIEFHHGSHECLPHVSSLKLVVFNLGYLPSGDKSLTTQVDSTLKSVQNALDAICHGGVVCITCYPGHLEGKKEQDALTKALSDLDPLTWSFTTFFWMNRNNSPSLFLVQKKCSI